MTEKTNLVSSSAVEKSLSPAASHISVVPSPDLPALDFTPARGESARAFEAFRAYFELGPRRRLAVAARKAGVCPRTVKRWAADFDWRGRIQSHAARSLEQSARAADSLQRADLLDAAARAKTFRDRQFALAESFLDIAERYLERMDEDNLDRLSFADACKAFAFASQLGKLAHETDPAAAQDHGLRDQLTALLDQACAETQAQKNAVNPANH